MFEYQEVTAPYPGLRPFQAHEAQIFFGRDAHTDRLLEILEREHFLAVIGPSGAGKSSLVRAGMLPALAAGWLGTGSDWRMAVLRPGDRPFRRLAEALAEPEALGEALPELVSSESGAALLEAELRRGPLGLVHLVEDSARAFPDSPAAKLVVLVDQFEELFRYAGSGANQADESEAFVNLLLASRAAKDRGIYVVLTMRTEFLGHCVRYLDLPEAINRAQYLTPRLSRKELESAITGPARVFGGDVAPELANELINSLSVDEDQLVLLQHALARMWRQAVLGGVSTPVLTSEDLDRLGGVGIELSAHADEVLKALPTEKQALAEALFRCITELEGAGEGARGLRRPQRLGQIAAAAGCGWEELVLVVALFAEAGVNFLHHGETLDEASVIDIAHEALIRQWGQLRGWAESEAERAEEYRRWRDRARQRRKAGELLSGADLARAVEWSRESGGWRPAAGWARRYEAQPQEVGFEQVLAYIQESEAQELERLRRIEEAALREERLEREKAEAQSDAARTRADAADRERELIRKRAQDLFAVGTTVVVAAVVAVAIFFRLQGIERLRVEVGERESLAKAWLAEAERHRQENLGLSSLLVVEAYRMTTTPETERAVREAYLKLPGVVQTLEGHTQALTSVQYRSDGQAILTASEDGTARLWDAKTGMSLAILAGHEGAVTAASFSPDGRRVVTAGVDGTARIWDVSTGAAMVTLEGHEAGLSGATFSEDGLEVLTASRDHSARIWDARTGEVRATLIGHSEGVAGAVFAAGGEIIVTASKDQSVRFWSASSGLEWEALRKTQDSGFAGITTGPGGALVATVSLDGTVQLWAVPTGHLQAALTGHLAEDKSVGFSQDGSTVITASLDRTARVWRSSSGQSRAVLVGHDGGLTSAILGQQGRIAITTSLDRTVRTWDTDTGQALAILSGHLDAVTWVAIAPDDCSFVTASNDKTGRVWPCRILAPAAEIADEIGRLVGRALTETEQEQFRWRLPQSGSESGSK